MSDERTAVYRVDDVNGIIAERNSLKEALQAIRKELGNPDCEHPCCCPGGCTGCRATSALAIIYNAIGD